MASPMAAVVVVMVGLRMASQWLGATPLLAQPPSSVDRLGDGGSEVPISSSFSTMVGGGGEMTCRAAWQRSTGGRVDAFDAAVSVGDMVVGEDETSTLRKTSQHVRWVLLSTYYIPHTSKDRRPKSRSVCGTGARYMPSH